MANHIRARAPEIARNLINAWVPHKQALDGLTLPYLDHLLTAMVGDNPTPVWKLILSFRELVPGMPLGTAKGLVHLKFGNPELSDIVSAG